MYSVHCTVKSGAEPDLHDHHGGVLCSTAGIHSSSTVCTLYSLELNLTNRTFLFDAKAVFISDRTFTKIR